MLDQLLAEVRRPCYSTARRSAKKLLWQGGKWGKYTNVPYGFFEVV